MAETKKSCVDCARMDEVKEDDPCPKLLPCVVFPAVKEMFKFYIPRPTSNQEDLVRDLGIL